MTTTLEDHEWASYPICPVCHHFFRDRESLIEQYEDDDSEMTSVTIECNECLTQYISTRTTLTFYSTKLAKEQP